MAYKTPGVYVEEISTFPPSVAEVATAVPAFIGYTAAGKKVARIDTMLDYQTQFGQANPAQFRIDFSEENSAFTINSIERITTANAPSYLMYYALSHYFKNGGGSCYIISVGDYSTVPAKDDFIGGLTKLEREDEPTLILFPDALNLSAAAYYEVCDLALAQCYKLGDRFAILDVLNGDVTTFRDKIGINNLKYGAAYHPYLQTTLTYQYEENEVSLSAGADGSTTWQGTFGETGVTVTYSGTAGDDPKVKIVGAGAEVTFEISDTHILTINGTSDETGNSVVAAWDSFTNSNDAAGFSVTANGDGSGNVPNTTNTNVDLAEQDAGAVTNATLDSIKSTNTSLYNQIKSALGGQRVTLPPSAAIAGVYATVDRNRGVWKAPANVSLTAVIGPITKITHEKQKNLNVDPTAGKSINAIRAFTGKGTLVWGARTLAGNDNEWRYVSVRRLFNMIEESTQKATGFAVFEPNDTTTWLKVKAMIESYLYGLWEQGALAGSTPDAAYFVNVGLGKTMTAQDILEGRMIVEIGVAAVRPAEFIILRFSHKMQEA